MSILNNKWLWAAATGIWLIQATKGSAKAAAPTGTNPLSSTTTPTSGGPVFPAPDAHASADVPAGQTVYARADGTRFWNYLDANGFDHYVVGVLDSAFITNEASITLNRRTGAKTSNDNDHRPSLDHPVAININLGGLRGAPGTLKVLG